MVILGRRILSALVALSFIAAAAGDVGAQSLRTAPAVTSGGEPAGFQIPDNPAFLQTAEPREKSGKRAFVYSLLLPGLGQWYAGDKAQARLFFAVEGTIWASFAVFMIQGYIREEDYKEFAQVFAGVSSTDHSDDYYSVIGEYNSWIPYEESVKSEGRFEFYPNTDARTLENYWIENRVSDYEPWVWQSADVRRNFRSQRSASRRSYRRGLYAAAAALLNRAASSFFAIGAAKRANRQEPIGYRVEVGAPWEGPDSGFRTGLSIVKTF
ncbi:MAG: hypothetical protein P8181_00435 [bacterium]